MDPGVNDAKNPPSLYRVFNSTVQRLPVNLKSLNSHAAFLFVKDDEREVIAWVGNECHPADLDLVKEIGLQVMTKDYRKKHVTEIAVVMEGTEVVQYLQVVLDLLWTNSSIYSRKTTVGERKQKIVNNSVSVGLIATNEDTDEFDFQETAFAHPDQKGSVPRVNFVPIKVKTVAYVNVGDQWDIWISNGVSEDEELDALRFLENTLSSQLSDNVAFKKELLSRYIHIVRQGEERVLFRRALKIFTDFEPTGQTVARRRSFGSVSSVVEGAAFDKKKPYGGLLPDRSAHPKSLTFDEAESMRIKSYDGFISTSGKNKDLKSSTNRRSKSRNSISFVEEKPNYMKFEDVKPVETQPECEPVFVRTVDELSTIRNEMLYLFEKENIGAEERAKLIESSMTDPEVLVGWQVEIDDGVYSGIFIVNKTKKTPITHKTLFHLAATDGDEFWVRLKRQRKSGVHFRPLRKLIKVSADLSTRELPQVPLELNTGDEQPYAVEQSGDGLKTLSDILLSEGNEEEEENNDRPNKEELDRDDASNAALDTTVERSGETDEIIGTTDE